MIGKIGTPANGKKYAQLISQLSEQKADVTTVNALDARVDAATQEIVDARVGADGTTYNSAGAAVRGQISDVKSDLTSEISARTALASRVSIVESDIGTLETHKVAQPLDSNNQPTNGTSGQSLRTKGDGTTEWSDVGLPSDYQTAEAVSNWLDEHPEATTTVQDGSLTEPKFSDALKLKAIKDYVIPEMFGAVGDGIADDTTSIINALKYSIEHKTQLVLPKKYYITETLLSNDYATSVTLNIKGVRPYKYLTRYSGDRNSNGSLIVSQGVNLFSGLIVYGSIETIGVITNVSTEADAYTSGSVFNECELRNFTFIGCCVARIGSFCIDTEAWGITLIKDNIFLNIVHFAKCTKSCRFVDSAIDGNYINGGKLTIDHSCFGYWQWNGSVVRDNFIDYYRIIYDPVNTDGNVAYLPLSTGNQYQVFRYLYNPNFTSNAITNHPYLTAFFVDDVINWLGGSDYASNYSKLNYIGHDGNTYDVPDCVIWTNSRVSLVFKIKIEANVNNIVFLDDQMTSYPGNKLEISINGDFKQNDAKVSVRQGGFYTGGQYRYKTIDLPFIDTVDSLPSVSAWDTSGNYVGRKVICNDLLYRLIYNMSTSTWEWVQINSIN